ncbi:MULTISPECIES: hypothetical protein [Flectobacillus]|uniref:hypothetical protein n=1 Tax=Flectobacillus TaxID=101 RepID=UPI000BA48A2D|nr:MULTISPECIES: hypothetical protein [Flectobacillus]MDI9870518.1 hypothetical protein [Flectobacillus roseus]NBA76408.1 hypothetical protein [Emticicia sp. ODNR4P]PAC27971.1 hypothetical protein BWI92_21335 [Flectobacillus sp. BAB-3569]
MKTFSFLFLILFGLTTTINAQIYSDSLIVNIQNNLVKLQNENENLKGRIELQSVSLNDISKNQSLTDRTKWEKIRTNLVKSAEVYKILSDDIIDLKSQVINQDYQGYIKKLSSVEKGPLGFSFEEVILKTAQNKAIFDKKEKNERFVSVLKSLKDSPIVGLIPYASQAVNLSTAAVNVAYAAGVQDKKVNFDKIKEFEKELQRYTGFYNALDKANLTNATSSSQTVTLLETLQLDVLEKFKKDGQKIGFNPREIRGDETIDDYFNYVMGEFTPELMRKKTAEIEKKYTGKDGKVNLGELLQSELDVRHVNNNLDYLQSLCNRFVGIHDNYFDLETRYFDQVKQAINVAKGNNIIEAVGEKNAQMVYEDLIKDLTSKKKKKDAAIKSSINIKELKDKIDSVDIYKIL